MNASTSRNASDSSGGISDVAELAPHHLLPREPRRPFARVVEEQHDSGLVQDADQRLRRLRECLSELVAELELIGLPLSAHRPKVSLSAGFCNFLTLPL